MKRWLSLLIILGFVTSIYAAATHWTGPVVSGTKAQGDEATVATGDGDIFAADAIECDGALDVGGGITNVGALSNTGTITLTGSITHDGLQVEVPSCTSTVTRTFGVAVSTSLPIVITDRYMVVGATMPKHQTLTANGHVITCSSTSWTQTISTSSYALGTIVTIFNSTGTIVLTDWATDSVYPVQDANTGLDLGAATRSLGIKDNITLMLLYIDNKRLWRELGFVDN